MSQLLMHYAIPSVNLPELARVGIAKIAMFAFRCDGCQSDFHIDERPNFCPICGSMITGEKDWSA